MVWALQQRSPLVWDHRITLAERDFNRSLVQPCSKQGQTRGQTRLLRALFSQVLKTSKDGACTASLGNLLYYLTVLIEENVFFVSL